MRAGAPRQPFDRARRRAALWDAKWDLGLPTLVIVAIATGFATIVEAAALGVAYALIVEMVIFRNLHPWRDLPRVLMTRPPWWARSSSCSAWPSASPTGWWTREVPTRLVEWMTEHVRARRSSSSR